jgi:small multidrug resistance pump
MAWLYLAFGIAAEVMGTLALKFSDGFTKTIPSSLVVIGYGAAFYFLSKVINTIPISVAYAIWSGAGVAIVGIVAWIWLGQKLDAGAIVGITLIISGVVVINLYSQSVLH